MSEVYDLGMILRELRLKAGLSQKELGAKINRDKGIISRYESNLQTPSFEIMRDLAAIFNVSMDYLAGKKPKELNTAGLTENQCDIMEDLVKIFRSGNTTDAENVSSERFSIICRISEEFADK